MDLRCEKLKIDDFQNTINLIDDGLKQLYGTNYEKWKLKLEKDFKKGYKIIIGAWYKNKLIGVLIYQRYQLYSNRKNTIELKTIYINENFRFQEPHAGSNLLKYFEYEICRSGYSRVIVEAKYDLDVVTWLIRKKFRVISTHNDYGWPCYKMEKRYQRMYTDDPHDYSLLLPWVGEQLGMSNFDYYPRGVPTYNGIFHFYSDIIESNLCARITYCIDWKVLDSCLNEDSNTSTISFYILNSNELQEDALKKVKDSNGQIIFKDDLKKILGLSSEPFSCSPDAKYCLLVLVYPDFFERIWDKFYNKPFDFIVSNRVGGLLKTPDSQIVFISNVEFNIMGTATYIDHEHISNPEEAFSKSKDNIIFTEDEFRRWSNLKRDFTIFHCNDLLRIRHDVTKNLYREALKNDKWLYYLYNDFMDEYWNAFDHGKKV